ncbi:hypothetical protein [Candidatus Nanohalovita haloferacivicina]|uniref:hypothetical protein n=1 Tax=Candidatus Nanohalovita haloferacivicina TaxID=2978046 RepID=UPI00325FD6B8|nr:hypothetical protein HBNXNv_0485 [Candidatus Nanohalobia archaeon BNXNv]
MGLQDHTWTKEDVAGHQYAGKYVTHGFINKNSIIEQVSPSHVDFELGEHTLEYDGEKMDVELYVTRDWAQFSYDQNFEEQLGDERFTDVILHFLTPDKHKKLSGLDGV